MYTVEVISDMTKNKGYFNFETYSSAINCLNVLTISNEVERTPEYYFHNGMLEDQAKGQIINNAPIVSYFVDSYFYNGELIKTV